MMLFISSQFLLFFVIVFSGYWLLPWHRARLLWLLIASAVFYMSWNPLLILLICVSASVDYVAAIWLERWQEARRRRLLLVASITVNLGLLVAFKYANFLLANLHWGCNLVGINFDRPVFRIALPLGISFYTFETISYVVDVYRRKIKAQQNLLDYALFMLFFPHLIAGPIVRPGDFLPQIRRPKRWSWDRAHAGVRLFVLGMLKKAVLADHLAGVVDPVFANPALYGTFAIWLAVVAYSVQIYGDFSGYSDMAVGLAHLFGFRLQANFNLPYLATNVSEFWRRWHISLSTWLRDYLYIPLGGSRRGTWITCRNLIFTMGLGGFWHGATWNMVLWGLYHGALLALPRLLFGRRERPLLPRPLAVVMTFLAVAAGWVVFRASSLAGAGLMLQHMVLWTAGTALPTATVSIALACLAVAALGHLLGNLGLDRTWHRRLPEPVIGAALALFLLATLLCIPESGQGFIYFQF